ncbi:MAG: glycerophosphodiester phosphodiesterase family protein [Candidatus Latescibacteria bacterium]|jgi:glycerophosphoryl diester phosphodiesterase|nr:glycerophosphodiester phosphodiesterase family protein [Candidatus Latescibacterota bacterium]MBT4140336.1 glycerophosphodiester phosphodiesterase family protein [Candidatus Latescibacterota bacterium]MBT4890036.1 glycerophosphodiester phosphodiesterase family protein [Rhodospirillales bacterium]
MIDLSDTDTVREHSPFLIAHRGGVIAPNAPEGSLAAIRLAAEHGYRMAELDAQETKNGEPVVFHDRTLTRSCGMDTEIRDLTSDEARAIVYRASDQHIATLDEALALCSSLNLWVMLDIKTFDNPPNSEQFFQRISDLLQVHNLTRTTVTISGHHLTQKHLVGKVLFRVTNEEFKKVQDGASVPLNHKFWFGLPEALPSEMVSKLQQNGALVMPAINTFRYPAHADRELAHQDIERLLNAGVDGFQIDSIYEDLFAKKK